MLYTEITKKLISSFNDAKIEEVGKIVFTGSTKYSGDELRQKKENAANLLITGQEKTPVIFHNEMDVVELTTIIERNKKTRFSIQDLGEKINYELSITEKTSEGVYWLDFHHHNETDTAKNWGIIYIYFRDNEYLKSKNLEVSHPVFYKLVSNCYGQLIIKNDVVFENIKDLEDFIIKASHLDIKSLYLQLKELEKNKTETITNETGRKR